jgi:serralysin
VIADFQRGADDIELASIDASAARAGNQPFKFIGAKAFSGAAGELRFKNGLLEGDVNANKLADFQIEVTGLSTLGADDFLL